MGLEAFLLSSCSHEQTRSALQSCVSGVLPRSDPPVVEGGGVGGGGAKHKQQCHLCVRHIPVQPGAGRSR